jgi:hypothetical protein
LPPTDTAVTEYHQIIQLKMPKSKGSTGGRLIQLSTAQYEKTLQYLLKQYNPDTDSSLTPKQRHTFKTRASKFLAMNDHKDGGWPHGYQLYIQSCTNIPDGLTVATKLYVPEDKKVQMIEEFHTTNGHFGRNKIHHLISQVHYGITEDDVLTVIKNCKKCQVRVFFIVITNDVNIGVETIQRSKGDSANTIFQS